MMCLMSADILIVVLVTVLCAPSSQSTSHGDGEVLTPKQRWKRQSCGPQQFKCKSGTCIESIYQCDGEVHCPDGSDETSEACLNSIAPVLASFLEPPLISYINSCPSYAFRCNYGGCVDGDAKCNGKKDCADNSDEVGCPNSPSESNGCKGNEFACKNGQCIDSYSTCDGTKHCTDGSDEIRELCGNLRCPGFSFQCSYGACIDGDGRCNGVVDCADSSDESPRLCTDKPSLPFTPSIPSPPPPVVTPAGSGCILPQFPANGMFTVGGSCTPPNCPEPGTNVGMSAVLTYSCNAGYTLVGSSVVYCISGTWYSQPPKCTAVACEPLVDQTRDLKCWLNRDPVPCNQNASPGTIAEAKCKLHYQLSPELSNYQIECNANGMWSRTLVPCVPECGRRNPDGIPFISFGTKGKFAEFPWHAGIYRDIKDSWQQICGGSLVSARIIISAAHCFYDDDAEQQFDTSLFKVVVGKYYRDWNTENKYQQEGQIRDIILHENYKGKVLNFVADIAVIRLRVDINITIAVRPVCIDRDGEYTSFQLNPGREGAVVGWGVNENMEPSEELVTAHLPYIAFDVCHKAVPDTFRPFVGSDKFCAGFQNGTSVCPGDSGGGLVFEALEGAAMGRWFLQGIVSVGVPPAGADRCFTKQYTAFTRTEQYIPFIKQFMR